ncbi:rab GTPase-activating protein 1-like [Aulostomus maculatus]
MMQEVSIVTVQDAQYTEQMTEEEILACLVAETAPSFTVPTKKAKLRESRLQIMEDKEDPLVKYLDENRRLEQASLRLEQENDNLAYRLITSKIALRNALDKAEDNVEALTKDLLVTKRHLQATEEEMSGKEEEAAMLKEVFRRELEKAEQEAKRSSGIIADYKQICSQLTNRLERQQAAHREEFDSLKSKVKACPRCQHALDSDEPAGPSPAAAHADQLRMNQPDQGKTTKGPTGSEQKKEDQEKVTLRVQIRELEKELAQTKLQMVEAKCKIQDLEHEKGILAHDLQEANNSWISKAFTSLRTSSGGLQTLSTVRDGAPTLGWSLHSSSLTKKLSWPHRDSRENI